MGKNKKHKIDTEDLKIIYPFLSITDETEEEYKERTRLSQNDTMAWILAGIFWGGMILYHFIIPLIFE